MGVGGEQYRGSCCQATPGIGRISSQGAMPWVTGVTQQTQSEVEGESMYIKIQSEHELAYQKALKKVIINLVDPEQ